MCGWVGGWVGVGERGKGGGRGVKGVCAARVAGLAQTLIRLARPRPTSALVCELLRIQNIGPAKIKVSHRPPPLKLKTC